MNNSKPRLSWERWAAVRYAGTDPNGHAHHYVDEGTISATESGAQRKAGAIDAKLATWAGSHPVLGIVLVQHRISRYADADEMAVRAEAVRRGAGQ